MNWRTRFCMCRRFRGVAYLERAEPGTIVPAFRDPEWQAWALAGSILMPRKTLTMLANRNPAAVADAYIVDAHHASPSQTTEDCSRNYTKEASYNVMIKFETHAPEIAEAGRKLLYQFGVGLAFLATVRKDGARGCIRSVRPSTSTDASMR